MYIYRRIILILTIFVVFFATTIHAQSSGNADGNGDGVINGLDYIVWLTNFGTHPTTGTNKGDYNNDTNVNGLDYIVWLTNFGNVSPLPTSSPQTSGEWSQFASTSQRTSYAPQIPSTPWKFKWSWNGAGADGKKQANHLSVPDLIQPITGGGRIYMIAANQVYALDKNTGNVLWTKGSLGTLNATGAYNAESLFIPSSDGHVYKINAQNGNTVSSFTGSGAFNQALLFANGVVYAGSSTGSVYAINSSTMAQQWVYSAGSPIATPTAISLVKNTIIVNSQDLYVHALNAANGQRLWRVKPTNRNYQAGNPDVNGAQFETGWPVIAETHGIVFVRYRLDWNTLWTWNPFPTTNAQIKANLTANLGQQALFALKLTDGTSAFVPNAGNGGAGDGGTLPMGPQPIIRTVDGKEVAYIIWRNGLTCAAGWCDGREDAAMGEMVLDNTTVSGYQAGDIRFIRNPDIQTDEMMNIAMGGDTIFHSHWLINSAVKITDRSGGLGATFTNPIKTTDSPFVIWRQCNGTNVCNYPGCTGNTVCGNSCPVSSSRFCSSGLYSYGDARSYPPGFYEYNNDMNGGSLPFTIISAGQVIVKTDDGALIVLESGTPTGYKTSAPAIAEKIDEQKILGSQSSQTYMYTEASDHIGEYRVFQGVIRSAVNRLPKALYLGFTTPHDGSLLVRVFAKDLKKFPYDPMGLIGKKIRVSGVVTSYWPENIDPEIIVTSPEQIEIIEL